MKSALLFLVRISKPPCSAIILYMSCICIWHYIFQEANLKTKYFWGLEAKVCIFHVSSHQSKGIFEAECKKPWWEICKFWMQTGTWRYTTEHRKKGHEVKMNGLLRVFPQSFLQTPCEVKNIFSTADWKGTSIYLSKDCSYCCLDPSCLSFLPIDS